MKLEAQFVAVAFAVMLIEGTACKINPDPEFSISELAVPILVKRAASGLLGPLNIFGTNKK